MKTIQGVHEIIEHYDTFIVDQWGVLHDGTRPYDGVLHTIAQLRAAHKQLVVLSNSSRRINMSMTSLTKMGFAPQDDFAHVVTSGEVACAVLQSPSMRMLKDWPPPPLTNAAATMTSKKAIVLGSGGDDDAAYLQDCGGWTLTTNVDEASLILTRGPYIIHCNDDSVLDCRQDPVAYQTALDALLQAAARRQLPMLVTNPDKKSPKGENMPGLIGDAYEKLLLSHTLVAQSSDATTPIPTSRPLVKRIGKPFPEVYDWALQKCGVTTTDKSRVCMVGDSLETDVAGAAAAGIAAVWVLRDGVHQTQVEGRPLSEGAQQVLESFNQNSKHSYAKGKILHPDYVVEHFTW